MTQEDIIKIIALIDKYSRWLEEAKYDNEPKVVLDPLREIIDDLYKLAKKK